MLEAHQESDQKRDPDPNQKRDPDPNHKRGPEPCWAWVAAMLVMLLCLPGLPRSAVADTGASSHTVVLIPDDRASWRASNVFNVMRPQHNYGKRFIEVETTPPGAMLDLFYVRSNFQKRYEQAESPVKVVLPTRAEAGPRDSVTIRAFKEGYRQREVSLRVSSNRDHVLLELDPLPNSLVAATQVYLAGRASLAFFTKESLTVRVQDRSDGFNVILAETAKGAGVDLTGLESPLLRHVEALQLGEDLLVRVRTNPGAKKGYELRSRQARDELRNLYVYSVEMVPPDGGVAAVQKARAALAAIGPSAVEGCALAWDSALRGALDPAELGRALAPKGSFSDPYLRAAMKRLGMVSPGHEIRMLDGSRFHGASGIELAAAMSQASDARGYLALLRAFVRKLEKPRYQLETLRGLVAPEMEHTAFLKAADAAHAAEARCRARGASTD